MTPSMVAAIDKTVARLAHAKFDTDPLLSLALSRATSVAESAKKRHGKIIEAAILDSLIPMTRYQAWAPGRFRIPASVDHLASLLADGGRIDGADFAYTGQGRSVQIDLMVYDRINQTLRSYEIKRAFGKNDAGKVRSILRDLRCIQGVLGSFGKGMGMDVKAAEARIVFWYGRRTIPKPWSLTGADMDRHFGCAVVAVVEEATATLSARVLSLIDGDTDPYPMQAALAFHGDPHA